MWIVSKLGFFSIVQSLTHDTPTFAVRARIKDDLSALMHATGVKEYEIFTTQDADYCYRVFVNAPILVTIMTALAVSVDYDNFKSKLATLPAMRGRIGVIHAVYHALEALRGVDRKRRHSEGETHDANADIDRNTFPRLQADGTLTKGRSLRYSEIESVFSQQVGIPDLLD